MNNLEKPTHPYNPQAIEKEVANHEKCANLNFLKKERKVLTSVPFVIQKLSKVQEAVTSACLMATASK